MKKILSFIFISFLTLDLNILAMENEPGKDQTMPQVQLSSIDKAKVTIASFGCIFYIIALLMAHDAKFVITNKKVVSWEHYPSIITGKPFRNLIRILAKSTKSNLQTLSNIWAVLTVITSALLAADLGLYIFRKISPIYLKI